MKIDLSKLATITKTNSSVIKSEIDVFCPSALIAEIEYYGGLKVTVLKIAQSYVVTYEMSVKKWTSNCTSPENVIKDVTNNIKLLQDTKILPKE